MSDVHREVLESDASVFFSVASIWEIAIKRGLGKLRAPSPLRPVFEDAGYTLLPVTAEHAESVGTLPRHHGDPFDRMLVVQARSAELTVLTADPAFKMYRVRLLFSD